MAKPTKEAPPLSLFKDDPDWNTPNSELVRVKRKKATKEKVKAQKKKVDNSNQIFPLDI
jgi:hypothetical protein